MIQVERFEHISMAVPALGPQIETMERLFGFRFTHQFESEEGYTGATLLIPGRSQVNWELIAPSTKDSFLHRFLAGPYGPGLHHVAVEVTSTAQAEAAIRADQTEPWGAPATDEADEERPTPETIYLHPRSGGRGFLWQLNQKQALPDIEESPPADEAYVPDDGDDATEVPADHEPDDSNAGAEDDAPNTLGIVAVNHLGHATPDRHDLAAWYERLFGCETVWESPDGDGSTTSFRTRVVEPPSRQFRFEAIEPASPDAFLGRFVEQRGEAMHHVTFEVGDWERALAACGTHQVPLFGERDGVCHEARWNEAFIHPRHTGGVLVQLFWEEQPGTWV